MSSLGLSCATQMHMDVVPDIRVCSCDAMMWRSTCQRALSQVEADLAGLARRLKKPLRPLWISQNSRIWIDQVAHPDNLPFTPVILVSASLPNARQRRFAREWPPLLLNILLQCKQEQCTLF